MKEPLTCLVVDVYHRVAVQVQIDNLRRPAPSVGGGSAYYHEPTERDRAWQAAKSKYDGLEPLGSEYLFMYDGLKLIT